MHNLFEDFLEKSLNWHNIFCTIIIVLLLHEIYVAIIS